MALQSDTGSAGQDLLLEADEFDPRCAPMVALADDFAFVRGDRELLDEMTAFGLRIGPPLGTLCLARAAATGQHQEVGRSGRWVSGS